MSVKGHRSLEERKVSDHGSVATVATESEFDRGISDEVRETRFLSRCWGVSNCSPEDIEGGVA